MPRKRKAKIDGDTGDVPPADHRFSTPQVLLAAYERTRERRGQMSAWQNIVRQYERMPYRSPQGEVKPCHGQLRFKVDQALATFVDYATGREEWVRFTCPNIAATGLASTYAAEISAAFHLYGIRTWRRRHYEIMAAAKEMLLFSHGIGYYEDNSSIYPSTIPTATVWPNVGSSQFPEEWDHCFIERRFTLTELWAKVATEEVASANGWNRAAVMRMIKDTDDTFKDETIEDIFEQFRAGRLAWEQADKPIDIVVALVREFDEKDGKRVSEHVFAYRGKTKDPPPGKDQAPGPEYLMSKPHSVANIGRRVKILTSQVENFFYSATSFAELIYTACKQYDIEINRVLECVSDNSKVYLESTSNEEQEDLQAARHGTYQVLKPGTRLAQNRIIRPVQEPADVIRMIMVDLNSGLGQYQSGEPHRKGGPKTATQSEIDLAESTRISSAHLEVYNTFFTALMEEVYRRFVESDTEEKQNFERYLKAKKVPKSAYDPENCILKSVSSPAAGSPAAKVQGSRVILETLATPARTPGEQQAKRDIIAAIKGAENVDGYLEANDALPIDEDTLIGLENEGLGDPGANPKNFPVTGEHLHMRHISAHLTDMERTVGVAEGLVENLGRFPKQDVGIYLQKATEALIGADNKGAHTLAHIELAKQGGSQPIKIQIQTYLQALGEINKRSDRMAGAIAQIQEARMQEAPQQDPDIAKKEALNKLEVEHEAMSLAQDYQKNEQKGAQLRSQSAQNAALKADLAVQNAQTKAQLDIIAARKKSAIDALNGRK